MVKAGSREKPSLPPGGAECSTPQQRGLKGWAIALGALIFGVVLGSLVGATATHWTEWNWGTKVVEWVAATGAWAGTLVTVTAVLVALNQAKTAREELIEAQRNSEQARKSQARLIHLEWATEEGEMVAGSNYDLSASKPPVLVGKIINHSPLSILDFEANITNLSPRLQRISTNGQILTGQETTTLRKSSLMAGGYTELRFVYKADELTKHIEEAVTAELGSGGTSNPFEELADRYNEVAEREWDDIKYPDTHPYIWEGLDIYEKFYQTAQFPEPAVSVEIQFTDAQGARWSRTDNSDPQALKSDPPSTTR